MNKILPLLLPALLTARASQPKPTPAQIGEMLKTARVTVATVDRPIRLSERTKAQAVGSIVAGSLLGGVTGVGASVEAARAAAETTDLIIRDIGSIENGAGADLALAKKFAGRFAAAPQNPDRHYALGVSAQEWELGYESFLGSEDYTLSYQFTL